MDISDDEELEPFEMTGNEFSYSRKKLTKEDMIYGMWAQHNSDEEEDTRKKGPVQFITSSEKGGEGSGDDSDYGEQELDEEAKQILEKLDQKKLEHAGKKSGVGTFAHASLEKNKNLTTIISEEKKDGSSTTKKSATTSSKPSFKKKQQYQQVRSQQTKTLTPDKDFGRWERYSNKFGSKMLSKMGWKQGTGLGSQGRGIVNPVQATSHKDFGKGLTHMQVKPAVSLVDVEGSDSEGEEKEVKPEQQWRKLKGVGKPKYDYKTVDELKQSSDQYRMRSGASAGVGSSTKVIDMTGPKKRVLSGYDAIHNRHARPDETSQKTSQQKLFMPELLHNIELLVTKTEQEIIQTDRKLRYNRDLVINLAHEKEQREAQRQEEAMQIEKLSEILSTIDVFEKRLKSDQVHLTLTECEEMMMDLQEKYPVEYAAYGLSSVAVAIVFPLIKSYIAGWNMLTTPNFPLGVFTRWKTLLREQQSEHTIPSSENMDPYDRLIWDIWMPKLRQVMSVWSPRHCDPLVDLLECWKFLIPGWILQNILDQMVMPKLQNELENWNPTTDVVPVHKWVHPWLPLMEKKLDPLYPSIRYKMAAALNNWHPSDKSAHKILEPWIEVFTPQVMEAFVVKTILPKLMYCLQMELHINPHQQDIAPFEWIMFWGDMIGAHHYARLLETSFFPKWIQVLTSWLANNPNFEEVTKWYTGWKGMLGDNLFRQPSVKFHLHHALDMMNRAVSGTFQPGARENMAYFVSTEKRRQTAPVENTVPVSASVRFKDVIEKMALEHNILFMPVPGHRRYEGKLLHNFGRATIYMDRAVVFVSRSPGQWSPVPLDELLRLA